MKRLLLIMLLAQILHANSIKDGFRMYGDIFQFMPLFVGFYSLGKEDYEGLGWLALSFGSTMAITQISKSTFVAIARRNEALAEISKRPDDGKFDGFPSGHTSSAFVAAGFAQKRYGSNLGVPITILATLVGYSRVVAERHTLAQVIAGAILGYGLGYLITPRLKEDVGINVGVESNTMNKQVYSIGVGYRF